MMGLYLCLKGAHWEWLTDCCVELLGKDPPAHQEINPRLCSRSHRGSKLFKYRVYLTLFSPDLRLESSGAVRRMRAWGGGPDVWGFNVLVWKYAASLRARDWRKGWKCYENLRFNLHRILRKFEKRKTQGDVKKFPPKSHHSHSQDYFSVHSCRAAAVLLVCSLVCLYLLKERCMSRSSLFFSHLALSAQWMLVEWTDKWKMERMDEQKKGGRLASVLALQLELWKSRGERKWSQILLQIISCQFHVTETQIKLARVKQIHICINI